MELVLETSDEKLLKLDKIEDAIFYRLFIEPIFKENIITILVEGQSGSGKSMFSLWLANKIEQIFKKVTGKYYDFDVDKQVIYIPQQYDYKLNEWVKSPYVTLVLDELRFLLPKNKWQSLLNQSIAETNAVIRAVKVKHSKHGGVIIYNTQDISDISKDARKTIFFDFQIKRLKKGVKVQPLQFWLDKKNVEKPMLRFKRVHVWIGGYRFQLSTLYPPLPPVYIRKKFKELSVKYKLKILEQKRKIIMREISREYHEDNFKEQLADDNFFEMIKNLAKFRKNKIVFSQENKEILCRLLNITRSQFRKEFIPAFEEEAKRRGLI